MKKLCLAIFFLVADLGFGAVQLSIVPLLVGMDVNDPKIKSQHLREGAFKLVIAKRQKDQRVPKGKILTQNPQAGTMQKAQTSIFVVISDGR